MFLKTHAGSARRKTLCKAIPALAGLVLIAMLAVALTPAPGLGQEAAVEPASSGDDVSMASESSGSSINYLCFTAQEALCTVALTWVNTEDENSPSFGQAWEISVDKETWSDYTIGETVSLKQTGDTLYWRAEDGVRTLGQNSNKYFQFILSGKVSASGSIMTLLDPTDSTRTLEIEHSPKKYTFLNLFLDCSSLTSAPDLPATRICNSCYENMFKGCTSLTVAPDLPATTLGYRCYKSMFAGCTSLTSAPDLPATVLQNLCYANMFEGCTSLTTMPLMGGGQEIALDAEQCCQSMFKNCSSLVVCSSPATGLECKLNCSSVTGDAATRTMFSGCSAAGDYHSKGLAAPSEAFICYGASPAELPCARGDVNGNGVINIVDAQIVLEMANGAWTSEGSQTPYDLLLAELAEAGRQWSADVLTQLADMDCSGTVDESDARAIQTYVQVS